ncbi:hypothetical protein SAMN04489806_1074 [Paramicrobacterium humi]|uniref:Uncharacterized protein n=1 Tax=Paramicrobacterium humi TaxID=640635 RepID=A0A1H4K960_9MICO|nr:hypothetical protein SAMN04489806_1074 [Microbacterium humi]
MTRNCTTASRRNFGLLNRRPGCAYPAKSFAKSFRELLTGSCRHCCDDQVSESRYGSRRRIDDSRERMTSVLGQPTVSEVKRSGGSASSEAPWDGQRVVPGQGAQLRSKSPRSVSVEGEGVQGRSGAKSAGRPKARRLRRPAGKFPTSEARQETQPGATLSYALFLSPSFRSFSGETRSDLLMYQRKRMGPTLLGPHQNPKGPTGGVGPSPSFSVGKSGFAWAHGSERSGTVGPSIERSEGARVDAHCIMLIRPRRGRGQRGCHCTATALVAASRRPHCSPECWYHSSGYQPEIGWYQWVDWYQRRPFPAESRGLAGTRVFALVAPRYQSCPNLSSAGSKLPILLVLPRRRHGCGASFFLQRRSLHRPRELLG